MFRYILLISFFVVSLAAVADAQTEVFANKIYSQYRCKFVLPLFDQGKKSKNRVGAILDGVQEIGDSKATLDLGDARYCVKSDEELTIGEKGVNFDYRRQFEATLTVKAEMSTFKLTALQAEYIKEIVMNMKNVKIADLPDDELDTFVQYAKAKPLCRAYKAPRLVSGNCSGEIDLKFYFRAGVTALNIQAVLGKLTIDVAGTVKVEEGEDVDPKDSSKRKYVRIYTPENTSAVFGINTRSAW